MTLLPIHPPQPALLRLQVTLCPECHTLLPAPREQGDGMRREDDLLNRQWSLDETQRWRVHLQRLEEVVGDGSGGDDAGIAAGGADDG